MQTRNYGRVRDVIEVPDLREIQVRSYRRFLQLGVPAHLRDNVGLEKALRETFPIESLDRTMVLEYLGYELAPPKHTPDECRKLRLTYGNPLRVRVRLVRPGHDAIEEPVFLGEMPRMVGGGEFIVNGVDRVIVSQLHRSPGIDFTEDRSTGDRVRYGARVIPERGSWLDFEVDRKDVLRVRIDQSPRLPATLLLRCFGRETSRTEDLLRIFYESRRVDLADPGALQEVEHAVAVTRLVDPHTGELLVEAGEEISSHKAQQLRALGFETVEVIPATAVHDRLVLNTIAAEGPVEGYEDALLRLYRQLRPGYPADFEKARKAFEQRFRDPSRYSLGRVGRFRIQRKFGRPPAPDTEQALLLQPEDVIDTIRYIVGLRTQRGGGEQRYFVDDIDHLGNRRVRTVGELAEQELRKGLLRLKRTAQERMSLLDPDKHELTPRTILQYRTVAGAIEAFFGRGELSQVVDQTNPLAQLTHERRLSALGPGGLNRKRAGFEVRDVHISHYGRICPIETPEGTNIGLINSLAVYATVDELGFLVTPYRVFRNGRFTGEVRYLRADEEDRAVIAPADTPTDDDGRIADAQVLARKGGEFTLVAAADVEYMDVSPRQMLSLSASLIPFIEHDDANRALMGSNMQRQAVALLDPRPPLVATGMERVVARNSAMVVCAEEGGVVQHVTGREIVIDDRRYELEKYRGIAEGSCLNQRPCVRPGQRVRKGEVIADGAATHRGELALGCNALVAFMSFDGYNFEDAILLSSRLVEDDELTSIHIETFEVEVRETDLGREEITADVPNVSRRALAHLDETGVARVGARVRPGDVLVGKVVPRSKAELTAEEKLLRAIFGRMGEDVKNESLVVPPGIEGWVIGVDRFARKAHMNERERRALEEETERTERQFDARRREVARALVTRLEQLLGGPVLIEGGAIRLHPDDVVRMETGEVRSLLMHGGLWRVDDALAREALERSESLLDRLEALEIEKQRRLERLVRGDRLPPGVLELVRVYVAHKRRIKVGDKLAGRHGNKGVVARILPKEDMPFLADGTPVDVLLNPLGVPSRMNVGQILETHLGWAARTAGFQAISPVFDGTSEQQIREELRRAGLPESGKTVLYDGRTGEPFDQEVTVGSMYLLKLHHMVDDKIHARATGPYSLITQQPLGGKARLGGQRFGEMEVWALEAYGAAHILQELLTVKSDDVDGRAKIYQAMVKGENVLEAGTPVSFDVLTHEIKGLCLNLELLRNGATIKPPEGKAAAPGIAPQPPPQAVGEAKD